VIFVEREALKLLTVRTTLLVLQSCIWCIIWTRTETEFTRWRGKVQMESRHGQLIQLDSHQMTSTRDIALSSRSALGCCSLNSRSRSSSSAWQLLKNYHEILGTVGLCSQDERNMKQDGELATAVVLSGYYWSVEPYWQYMLKCTVGIHHHLFTSVLEHVRFPIFGCLKPGCGARYSVVNFLILAT